MEYVFRQYNQVHLDTVAAPWIVPNFCPSFLFNQSKMVAIVISDSTDFYKSSVLRAFSVKVFSFLKAGLHQEIDSCKIDFLV